MVIVLPTPRQVMVGVLATLWQVMVSVLAAPRQVMVSVLATPQQVMVSVLATPRQVIVSVLATPRQVMVSVLASSVVDRWFDTQSPIEKLWYYVMTTSLYFQCINYFALLKLYVYAIIYVSLYHIQSWFDYMFQIPF